jgi:hypothetical protein
MAVVGAGQNPELAQTLSLTVTDHPSFNTAMGATRKHINALLAGTQQQEVERAKQRKGPAM